MPLTTDLDEGDRLEKYGGGQAGAVGFAAVLLIVVGLFHAIQGLVALINDDFYVATPSYVFEFNLTSWGWIHLLLGTLVFAAGVGLLSGKRWARTVAVVAASVSLVGNFAWLPYYPIWGLSLMALDVFIIWAAIVHGQDFVEE